MRQVSEELNEMTIEELEDLDPDDVPEYGSLRDAFGDWLEMWPRGWDNLDVRAVDYQGEVLSLRDLLEQFSKNEDIMPSEYCDCIDDLPLGSTYADAVREIKRKLGLD